MGSDENSDEKYFLTNPDREFLKGDRQLTEGSAQNARTRIRTRLLCALEDIEMLSTYGGVWKQSQFTEGMRSEPDDKVYRGLTHTVNLIYLLAATSAIDVERVFEDGIQRAHPFARDIDVSIELDHPPAYSPIDVKKKLASGELPTAWEVGMMHLLGDDEMGIKYGEDTTTMGELARKFAESRDIEGGDYIHTF